MNKYLCWLAVSSAFAANLFAQSSIEGDVKGVDGFPLKAAEIRAERQDAKSPSAATKTDSKGHFSFKGLAVGTYDVNVMSSGTAVSSTRIATRIDKPAQVTFDMKQPRKAVATIGGKKKKKFVWMPAETGSHIGGHYVEVDEDATEQKAQHLSKATGAAVRQYQSQNNIKDPSGGGR